MIPESDRADVLCIDTTHQSIHCDSGLVNPRATYRQQNIAPNFAVRFCNGCLLRRQRMYYS